MPSARSLGTKPSGAVPALLPWPGADTIYGPQRIHPSPAAVADALAALAADGWEDDAVAAQQEVREKFAQPYATHHCQSAMSTQGLLTEPAPSPSRPVP